MFVSWFDTAVCSVCGDQASSHDNVMATHNVTNVRAIAGHFNVCAKDECVLAIKRDRISPWFPRHRRLRLV